MKRKFIIDPYFWKCPKCHNYCLIDEEDNIMCYRDGSVICSDSNCSTVFHYCLDDCDYVARSPLNCCFQKLIFNM